MFQVGTDISLISAEYLRDVNTAFEAARGSNQKRLM